MIVFIRMLKYIFCLFLFIAGACHVVAQVRLKNPLSKEDQRFLEKQARDCFTFYPEIKLSYSSSDLFDQRNEKGDKPASMENLKLLEKTLTGTSSDVWTLVNISGMYSRLKMPKEAESYRQKSLDILYKVIEQHPDSFQAILLLGGVYTGGLRLDESIAAYRLAGLKKPDSPDPSVAIATIFMLTNRFDSAYAVIKERIDKYPDFVNSYLAVPMFYLYQMIDLLKKTDDKGNPRMLNTDSLLNMDLLQKYYERNKDKFDVEYLYRVSQQVFLSAIVPLNSMTDTAFDADHILFKAPAADKQKLKGAERFFSGLPEKKGIIV